VVRKLAGFDNEVDVVFNRALNVLKAHGAIVVDPVVLRMRTSCPPLS